MSSLAHEISFFRGNHLLAGFGYNARMITKIGPKKPYRHYLREWMRNRDLTQAAIADRLDVGKGTVNKLINGKMPLSERWLVGFSEALNIEVSDIFRDPARPTREELLADLSNEDQDTVIQLINVLRSKKLKKG